MFKYLSLVLFSLASFAQITTLPPASGTGGGGITSSTATPTQYTLVMYDTTSNTTVAEATGCTVSGGVLSCTGGFNAGVGTNPAVLELPELTANGTNSNWIAGHTTQSADTCVVWPTTASSSGQALTDSGSTLSVDPDGAGSVASRTCRVLSWSTVGGSDPSTLYTFEEDFLYWSTSSGAKGEKTWWNSSGTNNNSGWYDGEVTDHPGQVRLAILDIGNHQLYWGGVTNRFNFAATQNWIFLVRADETGTDYAYRCGVSSDPETHPASEEAVIEKATADTNWYYRTRAAAASSTRVDSTVAVSTSWIALKIRKSGSTWYFSTASTIAGLTGATELSIATNIPTGASRPFCYSSAAVGGWKGMYLDYIRGQVTVSR